MIDIPRSSTDRHFVEGLGVGIYRFFYTLNWGGNLPMAVTRALYKVYFSEYYTVCSYQNYFNTKSKLNDKIKIT